jgi:phage gpG-like protein
VPSGVQLLEKLAKGLKKLPRVGQREVSNELAEEMEALVLMGFEGSHDPEGKAWAPLKYRDGQPLRKTSSGGLMGSIAGRAFFGRFVRLGTPKNYAAFHNSPDPRESNLPRRQFLPDPGEVPDAWAATIEETADDALARAAKKVGLP